jgi:hypothetical protein
MFAPSYANKLFLGFFLLWSLKVHSSEGNKTQNSLMNSGDKARFVRPRALNIFFNYDNYRKTKAHLSSFHVAESVSSEMKVLRPLKLASRRIILGA